VTVKPLLEALCEAGLDNQISEAVERAVDRGVHEAVDERVGVSAPRETVEEAATGILEAVAQFHAHDLANAEVDLPDLLEAELGGRIDEILLEQVAADTLKADAGAHAAALRLLETALPVALASPPGVRARRVDMLLDGERSRLARRERSRPARARSNLLALIRLSDEALDAPARTAA
jgi:hypothetical protein